MSEPRRLDSSLESIVLAAQAVSPHVRLVGGTGLALLLGHRRSDDLHLFCGVREEIEPIVRAVEETGACAGRSAGARPIRPGVRAPRDPPCQRNAARGRRVGHGNSPRRRGYLRRPGPPPLPRRPRAVLLGSSRDRQVAGRPSTRPKPWPSWAHIAEASPHPARVGRRRAHESVVAAPARQIDRVVAREICARRAVRPRLEQRERR